MAASMSVANAAANGDLVLVQKFIQNGADVNLRSRDGMTPMAVAAFWGYSDIVQCLLENGADVNASNKGTMWTPLHCAAFQGHGKVIMNIMEYKPDFTLRDNQGRTAVDFASTLDSIWPFFAAAGCRRTTKADLIRMDVVKKVAGPKVDPTLPKSEYAHFSRPGSAYVMRSQPMRGEPQYEDRNMASASMNGDVLAGMPEEPVPWEKRMNNPSLTVWNN